MKNYKTLIITVDELWLKGANKDFFSKTLKKNLKRVLKTFHPAKFIYNDEGAKHVVSSELEFTDELIKRLLKTTGLNSIMPALVTDLSLESAKACIVKILPDLPVTAKSFRVTTKRTNKGFKVGSMQTSKELGSIVLQNKPHLKVQMKNADLEIIVSVLQKNIFISYERFFGVGGLPVGTAGSMVTLLSGGIDSPVASFLMAKRGVDQSFVFFHAHPFVGDEVVEKVKRLTTKIKPYVRFCPLHIVPFGAIQQTIAEKCPEGYQTLFFKIYMLKTANALARHLDAKGLITGDALSQVSSQTLDNIACVDQCLPGTTILRPLIGMNKIEISNLAEKIGTYKISIEPHDDACAMLSSKHPVTKGSPETCKQFLTEYPLNEAINECLQQTKRVVINLEEKISELQSYTEVDFNPHL